MAVPNFQLVGPINGYGRMSPDGQYLLFPRSSGHPTIQVYKLNHDGTDYQIDPYAVAPPRSAAGDVQAVSYSGDGTRVVVGTSTGFVGNQAYYHTMERTGSGSYTYNPVAFDLGDGPTGRVRCEGAIISPDGNMVLTGTVAGFEAGTRVFMRDGGTFVLAPSAAPPDSIAGGAFASDADVFMCTAPGAWQQPRRLHRYEFSGGSFTRTSDIPLPTLGGADIIPFADGRAAFVTAGGSVLVVRYDVAGAHESTEVLTLGEAGGEYTHSVVAAGDASIVMGVMNFESLVLKEWDGEAYVDADRGALPAGATSVAMSKDANYLLIGNMLYRPDYVAPPVAYDAYLECMQDSVDNPVPFTTSGAFESVELYTYPFAGIVSIDGSSMTYSPYLGYSGEDSFSYRVQTSTGGYSNVAYVNVFIVESQVVGCFWTDLVNATQMCSEAPPDPDPDPEPKGWPPFIVVADADPNVDVGINLSLTPSFDGPCSFAAYVDTLGETIDLSNTLFRNAAKLDSPPVCGETYTDFYPEMLVPLDSLAFDHLGGGVYNFPLHALQMFDPSIEVGDFVAVFLSLDAVGLPEVDVVGVFEVQGSPP